MRQLPLPTEFGSGILKLLPDIPSPRGFAEEVVCWMSVGVCARPNCDEKNSAAKIRAKPPNNLDDLTCEIGQARAVIETSCRIRNQTPDPEFGMICARACLARPTAAPNRTRPPASLDIEFCMCCPPS